MGGKSGQHAGKRMQVTMPHAMYELLQKQAKKDRRAPATLALFLLADALEYKLDDDDESEEAENT